MWQRIWNDTFDGLPPSHARFECLLWLLCIANACLMFATLRLWLPSPATDFAQVPWMSWGCTVPRTVDWILLVILALGLVGVLFTRPQGARNRVALIVLALAMVGLMSLNQQRTQPWAYQLVLICVVLASSPPGLAFGLLRLLTVGIYVHSGLSKLDLSFCDGLGRQFWEMGLSFTGDMGKLPLLQGWGWPLLFPVGELVIAIGLIWPRTRHVALWAACGMHVLLLLILGPWGLNHRPGVLIWNLFFLVQNLILFGPMRVKAAVAKEVAGTSNQRSVVGSWSAMILVAWAVTWPFLEPWGGCDVWPAWGLYAEHGEQLTVQVSEIGLAKLPPIWRDAAIPVENQVDPESQHIREWRLRWKSVSLERLSAPVYPSNRFLLGVALKIARDAGLEGTEMSATWESAANRWSGVRESRYLANLTELQQAADRCWFNARPRQ